jgi:hypothetical protein
MALERVVAVASAQWGVIGGEQLRDCGLSPGMIRSWRERGRLHLHPHLPGVYLVGHQHLPSEGELTAALLHAGPGAGLCDATAVWWWELISETPPLIHVCTTGRARSAGNVVVHHPAEVDTTRQKRLPVVPVERALREFAAHAPAGAIRQALAEADYRGRLDLDALHAELGRGRRGSARLRRQLARHEPRLARTRSGLEKLFLAICERYGVPLPEMNYRIGRMTVDAVWPVERLAVEIDGHRGHRTPFQTTRDRRREFHARAAGFAHVRYSEDQLVDEPALVGRDLLRSLAAAAARR